jgi:hypothetical protein
VHRRRRTPRWNEGCDIVFLEGGTLDVDMYDEDLSENDVMLTYSASGSDELVDLVRTEDVELANKLVDLLISVEPAF